MAKLDETEIVRRVEGVTVERLKTWVALGWVKPVLRDDAPGFTEADVARTALICDLHDSLGLDAEAVPVVLSLIDQIHGLRRELKCLVEALEEQPDEVRAAVRTRVERTVVRWRTEE